MGEFQYLPEGKMLLYSRTFQLAKKLAIYGYSVYNNQHS